MHYPKAHKVLKPLKRLAAIILIAPLLVYPAVSYASEESDEPDTETSKTSKTVVSQRVLPNTTFKRSQSLLEHMRLFDREDEVITLETTIYTTEATNPNTPAESQKDSFYGLYLEQESNNPQGAVLILHDSQQHGHWPEIIAPLREYLPQFGWSTLAIELPDTPARARIAREVIKPTTPKESSDESTEENNDTAEDTVNEGSENNQNEIQELTDNAEPESSSSLNTETEAEKDAEPALPRLQKLPDRAEGETAETSAEADKKLSPKILYQQRNSNRIIAAINHLKSLNQLNLVIIGHGTGAAWAIDYIQKQDKDSAEASKGLTLITIDALASQLTPQKMHEQVKDIKVPYLDLIHPEQIRAIQLADKRLKILTRSKNAQYQQFITPSMSNYKDTESPTNRRIRGWLKSNAQGSQINAAK